MKNQSILYSFLIAIVTILSIYFIMVNVFNLNTITDKYGNNRDVSFLKI